jgi:hypothetical protein
MHLKEMQLKLLEVRVKLLEVGKITTGALNTHHLG